MNNQRAAAAQATINAIAKDLRKFGVRYQRIIGYITTGLKFKLCTDKDKYKFAIYYNATDITIEISSSDKTKQGVRFNFEVGYEHMYIHDDFVTIFKGYCEYYFEGGREKYFNL